MKHILSYDEFVNEREDHKEVEAICESIHLNESIAVSVALLSSQIVLLNTMLARAGVYDPIGNWFDEKINRIKSTIRRHKKKKMTNATYAEFAEKIPEIYSQLETHWQHEIRRLKGELESAIAAKENFDGDKRTKEWSGFKGVKYRPEQIRNEIKRLEKKDFFKYIYTSEDFMSKNKDAMTLVDKTTREQLNLIARMIRDYVKDGKVKDSYWTERKYK